MLIALQRTIGTNDLSMIIDPDSDWNYLKIRMCKRWDVDEPFNRHRAWGDLRNGHILRHDGMIYQVWDTHTTSTYAEKLFQGPIRNLTGK